jgi:hypothetical protein
MLAPILASRPQFHQITLSYGTIGWAILHGTVPSDTDLRLLHELVEQAHLPSKPLFSVTVTNGF